MAAIADLRLDYDARVDIDYNPRLDVDYDPGLDIVTTLAYTSFAIALLILSTTEIDTTLSTLFSSVLLWSSNALGLAGNGPLGHTYMWSATGHDGSTPRPVLVGGD